jgi:ABC-type lipoprotein export system ATPase subunit
LQFFRQIMRQTRHLQRGRRIQKDVESGMRHMKREQGVNDLIQPGGEGKRCAVNLALVAEPAVRLSADPYGALNLRSRQRQMALVSGLSSKPLDNASKNSYNCLRERIKTRLFSIAW